MADLLPAYPPFHVGRQAGEEMPDHLDGRWRQQHDYQHYLSAAAAAQWPSDPNDHAPPHHPGHDSHGLDGLRMLQHNAGTQYIPSYSWDEPTTQHLVSPSMNFAAPTGAGAAAGQWTTSDMDLDTASSTTGGFHSDLGDAFSPRAPHHALPASRHTLPANLHHHSGSVHSPPNGMSPTDLTRPHLQRAFTLPGSKGGAAADDQQQQQSPGSHDSDTASGGGGAIAIPGSASTFPPSHAAHHSISSVHSAPSHGASGLGVEDTKPSSSHQSGNTAPRGRKRQRIPHTAVERRYRENLNAHLEKLRLSVPALAGRRVPSTSASTSGGGMLESAAAASSTGGGDGGVAKPSKCEILNGAIEHISDLGRRNAALESEVDGLRQRMRDLERWYRGAATAGGPGGGGGGAGGGGGLMVGGGALGLR